MHHLIAHYYDYARRVVSQICIMTTREIHPISPTRLIGTPPASSPGKALSYKALRIVHFALCIVLGVLPLQAQQNDDFDPVLPPDPAASYAVKVVSEPADGAVVTGGGAFNAGASIYISCTPKEGYALDYWTLDGTQYNTETAFYYTVEHKSVTFTAHLQAVGKHTLSVSTNLPDAAQVEGGGEYYPGHTVQISCTPNKDYNFQYWTLNGTVYSYALSFIYETRDGDADFVAVFTHTPHYSITAQPDDASAGYVVASDGEYLQGEVLGFEAYPYSEYTFSHWTLNGSYFTDQQSFTYTVGTMDARFVAVFDFNPEQPDDPATVLMSAVNVKSDPMGAATFNIQSGTQYHEGETLILRATMSDDYVFDGWYKGDEKVASTTAFTYIVGQKDVTFTLKATPVIYSQLNLVGVPEDAVTFNVRSGAIYKENTTLVLRASVVAGYVFQGWYMGDSLLSETTELQYTIGTTAVTLTAKANMIEPDPDEDWDPLPPTDPDMESVYIIAQSANSATGKAYGSASYVVGKEAVLRAVAAHGYIFSHWDDGNKDSVRTVIASVDATYTAYFKPVTYTVYVVADDDVMGSVSGSGVYSYRTSATITAAPAPGYRFVRWSDDNTDAQHTVYITSDTTFTAYFEPIAYTITVQSADAELGMVSGGGEYTIHNVVTLTATPLNYSTFLQWDDGNTDNPRTVTVEGDATYIALFQPYTEPEHPLNEGELTGKFQVSPTQYVVFSQGNLQYNAQCVMRNAQCVIRDDGSRGQGVWQLAENQYDYIGADNAEADSTYNGWIDIFGWGTSGWESGAKAYQPWCISQTAADYQPVDATSDLTGMADYADWGRYNAIYNGGNRPYEWRVLTAEEWLYLFQHGQWTMGRVQVSDKKSVRGFMLLPVGFQCPAGITVRLLGSGDESGTQKAVSQGDYAANRYTMEQFGKLQTAGMVFLPCAGFRDAGEVDYVNMVGGYWSSTAYGSLNAKALYFFSNMVDADYLPLRSFGYSVRLVKDAEAPLIPTDNAQNNAQCTMRNAQCSKMLIKGQMVIIRDDKCYNTLGVIIKK